MKQLIAGGRLLTAGHLDGAFASLLIDGDRIVAVLPPDEVVTDDACRIDATDRLLIPGLVNAHTHATAPLCKGFADRWSLELLLNAQPWTGGGRTLDLKYLSAFIGAVEMVRKGCTACYDLVAEIPAPSLDGIDTVARAYRDVGMRAVIAPMMADRAFIRPSPACSTAMPAAFRERAEGHPAQPLARRAWPRAVRPSRSGPGIATSCGQPWLRPSRTIAPTRSSPAAADSGGRSMRSGCTCTWPNPKCRRSWVSGATGTTLVGHLQKLGLLTPGFTAAHAIWLDDDDIRRLADCGAAVAHNPGSNLRLASGLAATRRMRDARRAVRGRYRRAAASPPTT